MTTFVMVGVLCGHMDKASFRFFKAYILMANCPTQIAKMLMIIRKKSKDVLLFSENSAINRLKRKRSKAISLMISMTKDPTLAIGTIILNTFIPKTSHWKNAKIVFNVTVHFVTDVGLFLKSISEKVSAEVPSFYLMQWISDIES